MILLLCCSYAAVTTAQAEEPDPCDHYNVLNDTWRATTNTNWQESHCDKDVQFKGWYRLFYEGRSVRLPDSCVDKYRCGTTYPLWLASPHPKPEDGIVTMTVKETISHSCSSFPTREPIRVKMCPGNYPVYELVDPNSECPYAYCADVSIPTTPTPGDPCDHYTVLNDTWRATTNTHWQEGHSDQDVQWHGWYRMFYEGRSVRIPEGFVKKYRCGTTYPLYMRDPHPTPEDGVVIRQVYATISDVFFLPENPIRVKMCPGNYPVYELVSPEYGASAYCIDPEKPVAKQLEDLVAKADA
ncbi:pancreatic secretory granule membrane major glycoprotein GP2-like [Engraulis encrasicolus]|uniref:pancreatic secretory granule membrane major glycoprotein GP2-like n=1 Tax=Engraulis encrasicolus TaxID=184585 RepID=UPI002FD00315